MVYQVGGIFSVVDAESGIDAYGTSRRGAFARLRDFPGVPAHACASV
jgi:hypothetical protein